MWPRPDRARATGARRCWFAASPRSRATPSAWSSSRARPAADGPARPPQRGRHPPLRRGARASRRAPGPRADALGRRPSTTRDVRGAGLHQRRGRRERATPTCSIPTGRSSPTRRATRRAAERVLRRASATTTDPARRHAASPTPTTSWRSGCRCAAGERDLIATANMHIPGRQLDPHQVRRDLRALDAWRAARR